MSPIEIMIRAHILSRGYARTYQLANRFSEPTTRMRQRLLKLEKRGVVKRDERSSAVNDICWVLAE